MIAVMWNNPDFNPGAPASDCHSDFLCCTVCLYKQVELFSPAAPQRIEDVFTSMRSDLLWIVTRWEQSGQGEGGMDTEEDEHQQHHAGGLEEDTVSLFGAASNTDELSSQAENLGSLGGRLACALASRALFLNGGPSYLLFFWEIADKHQLLQSSLQRLNSTTGASDTSCAPSSSANRSTSHWQQPCSQTGQDSAEEPSLLPLAQSMKSLVVNASNNWC